MRKTSININIETAKETDLMSLVLRKDVSFVKINLGPVVQNFVSLMLSLSPEFVNYISTSKANTLLFFFLFCFFENKNENLLQCILTFFSTKNNCICNIAI